MPKNSPHRKPPKTKKSNKALQLEQNQLAIDRTFTLTICGCEWDVYFVNAMVLMSISSGKTSMGLCDRGQQRLFIRAGLPYSKAMRILVHESTHAALSISCGSREGEIEAVNEEVVANVMEQLFADLREQEPLFNKQMLQKCDRNSSTQLVLTFERPQDMKGM